MLHMIEFAVAASMTVQKRKAASCLVFAEALRTRPLNTLWELSSTSSGFGGFNFQYIDSLATGAF